MCRKISGSINTASFAQPALLLFAATLALQSPPVSALEAANTEPTRFWLEEMDLHTLSQGWGKAQKARSVNGHPLRLAGKEFKHGIGTHAQSELIIALKGNAVRFKATAGVDDEVGRQGSVIFTAAIDGKPAFESGVLHGGDAPRSVDLNLTGAKTLELTVEDAGDGYASDHADWADAAITLAGADVAKPVPLPIPEEAIPEIASGDPKEPQIHGPRIVGTTPGRPFIFRVPFTGEGNISVTASGLPEGLSIDGAGIITGAVKSAGTYLVELTAQSPLGKAVRKLEIVAGDRKLALTPPMGWNSWNVWASAVTADRVRDAADALIKSGLAARGYGYINIDDTWEGAKRAADGQITTNKKFEDMKGLADYVHSRGLKLGIYSSPGPKTCAGYLGSYKHEDQDAATWSKWGIDYLKHDWCSYKNQQGNSVEGFKKPYVVMRQALDKVNRDIVYSLCQYGMGDVWKWGADKSVAGNCWRTCGDIGDYWTSMSANGFDVMSKSMAKYGGPGHWNDPDMLVVGKVGWGPTLHAPALTPSEQLTHLTLWSMLASPLLIGCDMTQMDKFTLDLLSNTEVIEVDQDPLGLPPERIAHDEKTEIWARPLFDGTTAVALFNRSSTPAKMSVKWADLKNGKISGQQPVRNLWTRKNLGNLDGYEATVARHGAVLLKVGASIVPQ